jgi:hypothetical protein
MRGVFVGQKSEIRRPGEAGGSRSDRAAVNGPMADRENSARRREGSGARVFPTLPIAQSAIGKVPRAGFRMGARNGNPSSAPESLSHSYIDSAMLDLAGRPAPVSLAVALLSFACRRPAPRRTALLVPATWLASSAPDAFASHPCWRSITFAPSPPHPDARSAGARIKSERSPR